MGMRMCRGQVLLLAAVVASTWTAVACSSGHDEKPSIELAKLDWGHVGIYVTITLFIVLSGLAKVGKSDKYHFSSVN